MFAEVPAVLDSLLKTDPSLRPIMGQLDRSQRSRAWNDGKVTAHHGIIPTLEPANLSALSEKELAVYRLIRAHYLAQFLPHHEFDRTVAEFSCGQQMLAATGKQVVIKGWRLVLAEPQADEDGDAAARSQVLPRCVRAWRARWPRSRSRRSRRCRPSPIPRANWSNR